MFTGLIEEVGNIIAIDHEDHLSRYKIGAQIILEGTEIGDSIAVNGTCLTVTALSEEGFTADLMPETLKRTGFDQYREGTLVNLERALKLGSRLGGHLVSGHIDDEAILIEIEKLSDIHELTFQLKEAHRGLIIPKGSIAIDGISLTIMKVAEFQFTVGIIPHTLNNTSLKTLRVNDRVNIEFDMFGKYIQAQYQALEKWSKYRDEQ